MKIRVETERRIEVRSGNQAGDGWWKACKAPAAILSPAAAATLAVVSPCQVIGRIVSTSRFLASNG